MLVWTLGLAWLTLGCSNGFNTDTVVVPEDTGRDTTPDPDSEEPDDTDTRIPDDTPVDTTPTFCDFDLSAELPFPGASPLGLCITDEVSAPSSRTAAPVVIEGSNQGGSTHFTKEMYGTWHCASTESSTAHYDGSERVFFLYQPSNSKIKLTLDKQCHRNLEMRVLRHAETDTCASENNNLIFCERDASAGPSGDQVVNITSTAFPQFYSIVIDGRNDTIANFKLTLECLEGTCR